MIFCRLQHCLLIHTRELPFVDVLACVLHVNSVGVIVRVITWSVNSIASGGDVLLPACIMLFTT